MRNNIHQGAVVRYSLEILGPDGLLVRRVPLKKNLILDGGLDAVASRAWVSNFTHAVVGTGTTPTRRDSGAITFSRAGTTVTASAGFFEAGDAGRLLKFDTGEEVRIVTFTSATEVETADSGTIASAEGTVWYVNQTALATFSKGTNTYTNDSGDNGTTFLADTLTFKRSFLFSAETGTVTYREIGWSHVGTGTSLFGRDLLAGAGVTLIAGQQLKAICELSVTISPASSTAFINPITGGFGDDGFHGIEFTGLARIDANGSLIYVGTDVLEPGSNVFPKSVGLDTSSAAISALSAGTPGTFNRQVGVSPVGSYASGSFQRVYQGLIPVSLGNGSSWRSICLGGGSGGSMTACYRVLMNTAQTKLSTHNLTLTFTFTWGRILTN